MRGHLVGGDILIKSESTLTDDTSWWLGKGGDQGGRRKRSSTVGPTLGAREPSKKKESDIQWGKQQAPYLD